MDAVEQLRLWRYEPHLFVRHNFRVEPDAWQRRALESFANKDHAKFRISLQACAGPGKSAVLAWCGWNFLSCYGDKGDHPKGAVTSITADNLKDNLWSELSKWRERSPYLMGGFEYTKTRIFSKSHPETWFLSARSFAKSSNADEQGRTLSGLHSGYVLYLIDESGDIPVAVLKSAEQGLSNCKFGRILQAGNPTSLTGMLYLAATKQRELWDVIRITGDPDDPMRSERIDKDWARQQIKEYGRDNPWVMSYILGEFPPSSINTLLGPDEVMRAMERTHKEDMYIHSQKRLGVDVARFGSDSTCLFPRQGLASWKPVIMRGATTTEIAARIAAAKLKWGQETEFIDGTGGYGGGVIDNLRVAGYSPIEVNASSRATDPRYYNKRAECWFAMAEWVKGHGCLPNLPELVKELTEPTYSFKSGKLIIEPKEQVKKRLGFSPDIADALSQTFAMPDMPSSLHNTLASGTLLNNSGKMKMDYDPFDDSRF